MNLEPGKLLMIAGVILVIAGLVVTFRAHIPWLGKLPGDILIKRSNFTFYFPLVTCLILSILLTLILNLFRK